jgi:hypothetical protein
VSIDLVLQLQRKGNAVRPSQASPGNKFDVFSQGTTSKIEWN